MSTRRSGGHSAGHSTSAVAIVESHTPATSSSHHRSSSGRHHQKQTSQQQHFDMSQIQHSINVLAAEPDAQKSPRPRISSTPASNGSSGKDIVAGDPGVKKERIKNLWGKVGKEGMLRAAAAKQPTAATTSSVPPPTKWDQVLNPLLQKQKQERVLFPGDPAAAAAYLHTTVGGEAGGGSGFYGQPGNTTMECDCGDDSCPQCNLMLNMGSNGW